MQLVGKDLHITAVLGKEQLQQQAEDLALETTWSTSDDAPHQVITTRETSKHAHDVIVILPLL